jgi:CheY-like chemotaxis protein
VEAIVLDASPEGVNAWEALPLLRRAGPEAHTPVVLLSVDIQHSPSEPGGNGRPALHRDRALLGEAARVLGGAGELARILVVEDNMDLARAVGEAFSVENTTVKLTHTRQEAQNEYLAFQPHLLVLDLGLPGGDGFRFVNWLREHENLARAPLVVYSGRDVEQTLPQRHTLEPSKFLAEAPVQPRQLEALILTILRGSSQIEEMLSEV